ncbi:MAG: hypothetical protein WBB74_10125 [Gaiellaceae bacterium]
MHLRFWLKPRPSTLLVSGYLVFVAGVTVFERADHDASLGLLASSPDALAHGKLWLLLTSGFVVAGPPVVQLAAIGVFAWLLLRARGARVLLDAALAGHVGSALVAYAGVAFLLLVDPQLVHHVSSAPDYGVSCVLAGLLGAITATTWQRRRAGHRSRLELGVPLLGIGVIAALTGLSPGLSTSEHALAFGLGMLAPILGRTSSAPRGHLGRYAEAASKASPLRM